MRVELSVMEHTFDLPGDAVPFQHQGASPKKVRGWKR